MPKSGKKKTVKTDIEARYKQLLKQVGEAAGLSQEEMESRWKELIERSTPARNMIEQKITPKRIERFSPHKLTTSLDPAIKSRYDEWNKKHRKDEKTIPRFVSDFLKVLLNDKPPEDKMQEIINIIRSYGFI